MTPNHSNRNSLNFDSIRDLMDIPREQNTISELLWHDNASKIFVDSETDLPAMVTEGVKNLFETYPYTDLHLLLAEVNDGNLEKQSIDDLRFMRKAMMVGRDALQLSADINKNDRQFKKVKRLVSNLGQIVDIIEQHPEVDITALVSSSKRSIDILSDDASLKMTASPVTSASLMEKMNTALETDYLLSDLSESHQEKEYHLARRLFRSVVHLGIVSQILLPNDNKMEFTKAGIELSAKYGENHDLLLISQRESLDMRFKDFIPNK